VKKVVKYVVYLLMVVLPLYSQAVQGFNKDIVVQTNIDWPTQIIRFVLTIPVDQQRLPNSRQQAEGWIERERFRVIADALSDLVLDSSGTFRQNADRRTPIQWNLNVVASHATREHAALSEDLRYLEVIYRLSISDLMRHVTVSMHQRVLPLLTSNQRSFEYSGIVIFVSPQLPVHGQYNLRAQLEPALAPTIFDEEGETLLSLATINSAAFSQGAGGVAYSFDSNMRQWSPRKVGFNPLVISAVAVRGEANKTDIVLSMRDADRLRASAQAMEMLYQAKVLVVIAS
jgi:hypothetical protein